MFVKKKRAFGPVFDVIDTKEAELHAKLVAFRKVVTRPMPREDDIREQANYMLDVITVAKRGTLTVFLTCGVEWCLEPKKGTTSAYWYCPPAEEEILDIKKVDRQYKTSPHMMPWGLMDEENESIAKLGEPSLEPQDGD